VSESRHGGNNASSVRCQAVNEKIMRPDHWLGLVICVPFAIVGWQEEHPACSPQRFFSGTGGGAGPKGNWLTLLLLEKVH